MIINKKAFSLVEMITVLVIIGLIAAIVSVSATSFRQKSRDVERLSDVKEMQSALELYRLNEGSYPSGLNFGGALNGSTSSSTVYMANVPNNPTITNTNACSGDYSYSLDNKGRYNLQFCLERSQDDLVAGYHCATPNGLVNGSCSQILLCRLSGGISNDYILGVAADDNYIYAVGRDYSNGSGGQGSIVKYNASDLSIVEKVHWGDENADTFAAVYVDSTYLYVGGDTFSVSPNNDVIFSIYNKNDLGAGPINTLILDGVTDRGDAIFKIISDGQYIYIIGYSAYNWYNGGDYDAIIVKYDKATMALVQQAYYRGGSYNLLRGAVIDGGYIYAVGVGSEPGRDWSGLIIKIKTADLSIVAQKSYKNSGTEEAFNDILKVGDALYVSGYSTYGGNYNGILLKYDSDLNLLAARKYGGSREDRFWALTSSNNKLYVGGQTNSENGTVDGLIVKYNLDLNFEMGKYFDGGGDDYIRQAAYVGGHNYWAGYSSSHGTGAYDEMLIRNIIMPSGTLDTDPAGYQFKDTVNCVDSAINLTHEDFNATTGNPNLHQTTDNQAYGTSTFSSYLYTIQ